MSQQHIPQPNSQSAAPAEVFDSTADAPHGASVSALGIPGPTPGEVVKHSGQKNTFDFSIHRQFIPTDTFIWSTSQTKGTLLWHQPIHPSRCNPLISYLAGMYNTWGGGIEFNFKVAGTGFHAGALAFVRIPPNFHPTKFSTPSKWGAFEWCIMDPKTLEVMSLDVMDQRPVMFHYMNYHLDQPNTFGGHIACYVLVPLNTSSSGSQQIAVQVFSRPGVTFTLNQLIVPQLDDPDVPSMSHLESLLNPNRSALGTRSKLNVRFIRCSPKDLQRIALYNVTDFGGTPPHVQRPYSWNTVPPQFRCISSTASSCRAWLVSGGMVAPTDDYGGVCIYFKDGATTWTTVTYLKQSTPTFKMTVTDPSKPEVQVYIDFGVDMGGVATIPVDANIALMNMTTSWANSTNFEGNAPTKMSFSIPVKGEVVLEYYGGDRDPAKPSYKDWQLTSLAEYCRLNPDTMTKDDALFFSVIDESSKLVLMTAKLYYEGVMTVDEKFSGILIQDPCFFAFDSFAQRTSKIPVTTQQLMNTRLLCGASAKAVSA